MIHNMLNKLEEVQQKYKALEAYYRESAQYAKVRLNISIFGIWGIQYDYKHVPGGVLSN